MGKFKPRIRRPRATPHITYDMPALCAAYKFPQLTPTKSVTIGIIELGGGYKPTDHATAFSTWKLPAPSILDVSVDGGKNAPGDDADVEVVLDIQVASAVYAYCTGKSASVKVYFAPNTDAGFADAVKRATADGCAVISISWGGPEDSWGTSITAFSAACAAARAAGVVVFAASGDNDSGDGERRGVHCDYPASDPNVVGCGGTSKSTSAETVWNDGVNGTGGGYSTVFPAQAYQVGVPAKTGRMVPDVAGNADPQTGYKIFLNGSWTVIGGTSAVAPLWAGLVAAMASTGLLSGDFLTKVWGAKAGFTDITSGNNGKYTASAGPDPCTGLGVPIGVALFQALSGTTPVSPPVVPPPPPVVPPPPPPPVVPPPSPPPVTKLGKFEIDLDAKTYSAPAGFKQTTAPAFDFETINVPDLEVNILRLLLDIRLGNKSAYVGDVAKILADLGLTLPV